MPNKDISDLQDLDQMAEEIGMGGNIDSNINKKTYENRMKKRHEIQKKRLNERSKEKGLILVFTGNGKGKTTASLGIALRTLGHNHKIAIIQFIKGSWEPGELNALKFFGNNVSFKALGEGFTWETKNREKDTKIVKDTWDYSISFIRNDEYKLVILDEINIAIKLGYISINTVIQEIKKRPPLTHVVLTGRHAHKELIAEADLVTEMNLVKHPFREQGVKAQEGIEY